MGRARALSVGVVAALAMAGLPATLGNPCPPHPSCAHCVAATGDGNCAQTQSGAVCEAVCDAGWYATQTWTDNGVKDGYTCSGNGHPQWTLPKNTPPSRPRLPADVPRRANRPRHVP